jgi:hypothetical protein
VNEEKPLPNGWRVTELSGSKLEAHLKEVHQMAEVLKAMPRPKHTVITHWEGKPIESLNAEERKGLEAFYFSQQPKSTQDAILRQRERKPSEDIDYLLRPMPECIANPDAKTKEELVGERTISANDMRLHLSAKSHRGKWGESKASSVSDERRTAGIEAFTYSKPANLTDSEIWRIKSLNEIDAIVAAEPPKQQVEEKLPWRERFRLRFNEIFGDWIY